MLEAIFDVSELQEIGICLIEFTRACLLDCFGGHQVNPPHSEVDLFQFPPIERVNVTLRTRGQLRGSMSAPGDNLGQQLKAAATRSALDERFRARLSAGEAEGVDIELWLQTSSRRIPVGDIEYGQFLDLGTDGIEIRLGDKSAYYKPSVVVTKGKHSLEELMEGLCRKAGLPPDAWKSREAVVLKTSWFSVSSGPCGIGLLQAHSRREIDKETVRQWLKESVDYLVNSQQATKDFTYLYDPFKDLEVLEKPNQVRSAGCLYALSRFYDSSYCDLADGNFADAVNSFARAQVERTILWLNVGRIMPEPHVSHEPKLGSTALLTLALGGERLLQTFGSAYRELYESVVSAQQVSGRFLTHFGNPIEAVRSSEFFSGQALLALVQRAARGDGEALERCTKAFQPYRDQFLADPSSAFVGWHVDVWSRMAHLTGRSDFAEFSFEQTDWLLQMQLTSVSAQGWLGGFSATGRMPKFSSIVFLEAVVHAYTLAVAIGDLNRIERYRRAIQIGFRFCSQLRLQAEQMIWFPNPNRSRGGIALSPIDKRIRCDVPQHFITLCLNLLAADELF